MKKLLAATILALWASAPAQADPDGQPMAVYFTAAWCGSCRTLEPKLEEARNGLEQRIRFVVLDVTAEQQRRDSERTARDLGIDRILTQNDSAGWVALVDRDGALVGELRSTMTPRQMRQALEAHAEM